MSFSFAKNFNFQNFSSSLQGSLKEISKDVNNALKPLNENLQPFTQKTFRLIQGRFIPNEDVSELPQEYLLLEKKCDTLRNVYKQLLSVTQTYEIEGYDYPPNLKESIVDFSKAFSEKVQGLAAAATTEEAEKILSTPSSSQQYPNTLAHALSRACFSSRNLLLKIDQNSNRNALAKVLFLLGESQRDIGDKRLDQDKLIFQEFNQKIQDILNKSFKETTDDRKKVETSRLVFDQLRHEIKLDKIKREKLIELNNKLEIAEDELVNNTAQAVNSMKKLIDPLESINLIKIFIKIQLNYHQFIVNKYNTLLTEIDKIPIDDEEEEDDDDGETDSSDDE
ncbi:uncharacterized protein ASCRUDRAFT_47457 [Ascoidea rubescens DSM 1968]|uniref:BAR domain-containing protein n=1 Tax=Ascoidea rubescens DSM 1968 TaxID=1344418 RepID=A0A1D2VFF2_9ASCO|nr:hypothetical protein ASCRUDRAFT_47457 [Ascoidea rubescens DSM 1968]ODV60329.1 hypothetical protein ASCRUDRAFT_47457 [Ascoidea rubescens DSM 1968]